MNIITKNKLPIKIWSDIHTVESAAIDQLSNVANLPFVFKHVAVMPDVHVGKGATVGSVIATKGAISPATVGVDIGCGMMAVKTKLNYKLVQDKIKEIRHSIERSVPVGKNWNKSADDKLIAEFVKRVYPLNEKLPEFVKGLNLSTVCQQLGTLGGGNHFIEICLDESNNVWVMLHSGSRNLGKVLAEQYIQKAQDICRQYFVKLPDKDLAYLAEGTKEFTEYINSVLYAQEFAKLNREEMMTRVLREIGWYCNDKQPIERLQEINCHHNYIAIENHFGDNVFITRKGAVRARLGDFGIIPGSMGAKSYIVEGLGNPESFCSCSHGAGRLMSRTKAKEKFTIEDLAEQTKGVECRKDGGVVDEIPGAYKDIDVVMENQKDLVKPVAVLKQILCVKG